MKLHRLFAAADALLAVLPSPGWVWHPFATGAIDPVSVFEATGRMFTPAELERAHRFLVRAGLADPLTLLGPAPAPPAADEPE